MKLFIEQKPTYHIDWLTYAHVSGRGQCGLGEYIARQLGREDEIEMLESPNDTHYVVNGHYSSSCDRDPLFINERNEVFERMKKKGYVECWRMRQVILGCVDRGWLAEGTYAIHMSW